MKVCACATESSQRLRWRAPGWLSPSDSSSDRSAAHSTTRVEQFARLLCGPRTRVRSMRRRVRRSSWCRPRPVGRSRCPLPHDPRHRHPHRRKRHCPSRHRPSRHCPRLQIAPRAVRRARTGRPSMSKIRIPRTHQPPPLPRPAHSLRRSLVIDLPLSALCRRSSTLPPVLGRAHRDA